MSVAATLSTVCPTCHDCFTDQRDPHHHCRTCSLTYGVIAGIGDFRTGSDAAGVDQEAETAELTTLLESVEKISFEELLTALFDFSKFTPAVAELYRDVRRQAPHYGHVQVDEALKRIQSLGIVVNSGAALELGCGPGGALLRLAQLFDDVAGEDLSLRELVLARKVLMDAGHTKSTLACAPAELLPFAAEQFDFVVGFNILEHVNDVRKTVHEALRVLKPGGVAYFSMPNRFWFMESHVRLPFVGWLPYCFQQPYVRMLKGLEFKGTRLLSTWQTRRLLRNIAGSAVTVGTLENPMRQSWGRVHAVSGPVHLIIGGVSRLLAATSFAPCIDVIVQKSSHK